jgi:protein O-mannosyl-transferase
MKKPKKSKEQDIIPIKNAKLHWIASVLIVALTAIVYSGSLRNSFQFDDIPRILQNQNITEFSSLWKEYPFFHGKRAVVNFTLWLNYRLGGHEPKEIRGAEKDLLPNALVEYSVWRYRLFNLLIHCANGVLAYFLVMKILTTIQWTGEDFKQWLVALGTALIFVLHPIQTQSVTYIIQRAELLAAFFQFIALLCYIGVRTREKTWQRIILLISTLVCYVLALESKEQAAIFPVMVVLFEILLLRNKRNQRLPVFTTTMALILMLTAIFLHNLAITYKGDTAAGFDIKGISKGEYALTNLRVFFTYLRLLFLPVNQNLDYDYALSTSLFNPVSTLFALLVLLGIIGIAAAMAKKQPLYAFGIFFFLIALAPSSSFIPIVDAIFEHRLYMPSFGLFLLITLFIERLYAMAGRRQIAWRNAAFGAVCGTVIIGCSAATVKRNLIWRTPLTLWEDVVAKSPEKSRGWANLGHEHYLIYKKLNNTPDAKEHLDIARAYFEKSIELKEKQPDTYTNLSLVYLELGRGDDAIAALMIAVREDPENPMRYLKLADMYYRLDRNEESAEYFEALFVKKPVMRGRFEGHPELRKAMAKTYLALGVKYEVNEAGERYGAGFPIGKVIDAYGKSLEWAPLAETYYSLAVVFDATGNPAEALTNYKRVLEIKPDFYRPEVNAETIRNRIKKLESLN